MMVGTNPTLLWDTSSDRKKQNTRRHAPAEPLRVAMVASVPPVSSAALLSCVLGICLGFWPSEALDGSLPSCMDGSGRWDGQWSGRWPELARELRQSIAAAETLKRSVCIRIRSATLWHLRLLETALDALLYYLWWIPACCVPAAVLMALRGSYSVCRLPWAIVALSVRRTVIFYCGMAMLLATTALGPQRLARLNEARADLVTAGVQGLIRWLEERFGLSKDVESPLDCPATATTVAALTLLAEAPNLLAAVAEAAAQGVDLHALGQAAGVVAHLATTAAAHQHLQQLPCCG